MNLTKKMKTRCVTMDQNKLNRVLESMKETGIEQTAQFQTRHLSII